MGPKIQEILRKMFVRTLMLADVVLLLASFGVTSAFVKGANMWTTMSGFFESKFSITSVVFFVCGLLLGHSVLYMCNLYESKRLSTKRAETFDVLKAITIFTVFLWILGKSVGVFELGIPFLLAFWVCACVLIAAVRVLLRYCLGAIRKRGGNLHHVLILGTNARAIHFGQKIEAMPERGCRLLGFVDDDWKGMDQFNESGFKLVSNYEGLAEYLRKNVVDEIAIYYPLRSFYERGAEIAKLAKYHGVLMRWDSDIFDLKFPNHRAEATDGVPQIVASSSGVDGWQLLYKRLFDIVGSLVLLSLFSPVFLIVAMLIKLTSRGTIFFSQKRVGLNKRQFTMYKFRTMIPAAESIQEKVAHLNEMSGPVFKIKNDPRVTPIGRILRKTSIDELPQLFNVLIGDMSLVGPRAMSVRDYEFFSEDWQRRRFSVPPGITCLWQVYGRNTIPFEQWMVLDMQYIDGWSLWLDIKILALTIPAVFRGVGAG